MYVYSLLNIFYDAQLDAHFGMTWSRDCDHPMWLCVRLPAI